MLASVLHTVIIYAVVIFAMRLMGKRQLGELQPSELVTTFMISNVASICIDEPDLPLLSSLVPILLIAALEILNSTAAYYLPGYAALLFGRPVTVIQDGQIRQDALRHLRMTPGDLMEALRGKDIFDPRQVVWGVVEPNGSISAAQKMADDSPLLPLLVDQEVYPENLAQLGRNEAWLDTDLARRGMRRAEVLAYLGNKESCVVIQKKTAQNGRSEKPESTGGNQTILLRPAGGSAAWLQTVCKRHCGQPARPGAKRLCADTDAPVPAGAAGFPAGRAQCKAGQQKAGAAGAPQRAGSHERNHGGFAAVCQPGKPGRPCGGSCTGAGAD